jgi:excisionase family DNA binding protein
MTAIDPDTDVGPASHPPLLLTVPDAARVLGISRSMAYNLITARELEVVHIGRCARVPYDAAVRFVDRLRRSDHADAMTG